MDTEEDSKDGQDSSHLEHEDEKQKALQGLFEEEEEEEEGEKEKDSPNESSTLDSTSRSFRPFSTEAPSDRDDDEDHESFSQDKVQGYSGLFEEEEESDAFQEETMPSDDHEEASSPSRLSGSRDTLPRFHDISTPILTLPDDEPGSRIALVKWPSYIKVNAEPYDASKLTLADVVEFEGEDEEVAAERLGNMLQYKNVTQENGDVQRVSNGHFVQWSNGSWSLVIGDKIFDMTVHSLEDEHVFLYAPVQQTAVLQDVGRVQERFIVKRVTEAGRKRAPIKSMRESRVKMAVTIKDPEKMKIEMERTELEKSKLARRIETKRRSAAQQKLNRMYQAPSLTKEFFEEDEDEFGETESGARKAVPLKKSHVTKKRRKYDDDDEDSEPDEEEEDADYNEYEDEEGDDDEEEEDEATPSSDEESEAEMTSEDEDEDEDKEDTKKDKATLSGKKPATKPLKRHILESDSE